MPTVRESFEWSAQADFIDEASTGGFTQNTGNVDVTFSIQAVNYSPNTEFEVDTGNVAGIDTDGLGIINANSSLASELDQIDECALYNLDFADPVENVDFRINDIDANSQVVVKAYDINGDQIPLTINSGSGVAVSDNDGFSGAETLDSLGGTANPDSEDYSAFIEIQGPVAKIEIMHIQTGAEDSIIQISDVYFNTNVIANDVTVDGTSGDDLMVVGYVDADNNTIDGADGDNDIILGYEGNDRIVGGAGADSIYAGDDADKIFLSDGEFDGDVIFGGEGGDDFDNVRATGVTENLTVTYDGNESGTIEGAMSGDAVVFSEIEFVSTGSGHDTVDGSGTTAGIIVSTGGGLDSIFGGIGDDTIESGSGNDTIITGDGNDYVDGGRDDDIINTAGSNNDGTDYTLDFPSPYDAFDVTGDADPDDDKDEVRGGDGNDSITTGDDADIIFGGSGADTIDAGIDDDYVEGGTGNDSVDAGLGSDELYGGDGNDVLYAGDDTFTDNANSDPAFPFADPNPSDDIDTVYGDAGNDIIFTGDDSDTLYGGDGDDELYSGIDDDELYGGLGSDTLDGGEGADELYGGRDDDDFLLGAGDSAVGGHGDDVFVVNATATDGTLIYIDGSDGGEGENPGDTSNDNYPGADQPNGDVLDLTNLFTSGLAKSGAITYTAPDNESGFVTLADNSIIHFEEIENIIVCFVRGTMIMTDKGEVEIENLKVGDKVLTKDNSQQELRWIGSRVVPAKGKLAPIVIKSGAMNNDSDLLVSQQHRMIVEGWKAELLFGEREVLTAAKHLINNDTIYVREGGEVEYFHMLFDGHEIIYANGAASESFHPGEVGIAALSEDAREEIYALFPELREDISVYGPSARTSLKGHEAKVLAENPDFLN